MLSKLGCLATMFWNLKKLSIYAVFTMFSTFYYKTIAGKSWHWGLLLQHWHSSCSWQKFRRLCKLMLLYLGCLATSNHVLKNAKKVNIFHFLHFLPHFIINELQLNLDTEAYYHSIGFILAHNKSFKHLHVTNIVVTRLLSNHVLIVFFYINI